MKSNLWRKLSLGLLQEACDLGFLSFKPLKKKRDIFYYYNELSWKKRNPDCMS